jgi:tRNA dimethylallyltransferase
LAGARVPVLVGPTAVGKTAVAVVLSAQWPMEIISADSRQVYRRLDIGTAKPTRKERARAPHHGLDLVEPGTRYSAGHFARDAVHWLADIRARGKLPMVVGGTGLYVRALAEGLFAEPPLDTAKRRSLDAWTARLEPIELLRWAARLDPGFRGGGRQRAARAIEVALLSGHPLSHWQQVARAQGSLDPWYIVLTVPRPVLHQRIARRAEEMIRRGLIEEVAAVLAEGHAANTPGLDGIGIREAVEYLHGRRRRETVAEAIATGTRQYAKRQQTWFRHQLTGNVISLDATRSPEKLASEIAELWEKTVSRQPTISP